MRKLLSLALPALLAAALLHPASAQDTKGAAKAPPAKAPAASKKGAAKGAAKGTAKKEGTTRVSGMVKGSPTGTTFTVGRRGGPVTVDASGAKIRVNGKFGSISDITGGTQVTVTGTMTGTTLKATEVDAHPRKARATKGAAKKGGAANAGKSAPAGTPAKK